MRRHLLGWFIVVLVPVSGRAGDAPTSAPAFVTADMTPKAFVKAWNHHGADMTADQMLTLYAMHGEKETALARAEAADGVAIAKLQRAVLDKWGRDAERDFARVCPTDTEADDDSAAETITGDHATVEFPQETNIPPTPLVKVDGCWKLDMAAVVAQVGDVEACRQECLAEVPLYGGVLRDLAAGKYKTARELDDYLTAELNKLLPTTQPAVASTQAATTQPLDTMVRAVTGVVAGLAAAGVARALHVAAAMGQVDKVRALLQGGADVNARDSNGDTPLHLAVAGLAGQSCVDALLAAGARANVQDNDGHTPLYNAMGVGIDDAALVRKLLAAHADANLADHRGVTPLHRAAERGEKGCVAALLAGGAKVDPRHDAGNTPLLDAARDGWDEVIPALLAAHADVNAREKDGWSALALAADTPYPEVMKLLEQAGATEASWTPLHWAAVHGDQGALSKALADKAPVAGGVNARDRYGRTPLLWAALAPAPLTQLLLAAGADAKAADAKKRTAAQLAASAGDADVLKLLIAAGADVTAADDRGWAPLHGAAYAGDPDSVALLLGAKVPLNARTAEGATALLIAADDSQRWHFRQKDRIQKVLQLLVDAGADASLGDNSGQTPARGCFWADAEIRAAVEAHAAADGDADVERLLGRYAAGPDGQPPKLPALSAATPQGAIQILVRALFQGDRRALADDFTGAPAQLEVVKALLGDFPAAILDFRRAMLGAYGRQGWLEFQRGNFKLTMLAIDEADIAKWPAEVTGDKAVIDAPELEIGGQKLRLVRRDGVWRIDAAAFVPPGADPQRMVESYRKLTRQLTDARAHIGGPGVTPASLSEELAHGMFGGEIRGGAVLCPGVGGVQCRM